MREELISYQSRNQVEFLVSNCLNQSKAKIAHLLVISHIDQLEPDLSKRRSAHQVTVVDLSTACFSKAQTPMISMLRCSYLLRNLCSHKARCATLEDTVLDMGPTPTYGLASSSRKDTNAVASCLKTSEPEYTSFSSRRYLIFLVSVNAAPEILRQAT